MTLEMQGLMPRKWNNKDAFGFCGHIVKRQTSVYGKRTYKNNGANRDSHMLYL